MTEVEVHQVEAIAVEAADEKKAHREEIIHHRGSPDYICNWEGECKKKFKSRPNAEKHLQVVHMKQRKHYRCVTPGCHRTFRDRSSAKRHTKLPAKFICPLCNKGYKRKDYLKQHAERFCKGQL
ncbi:hypothetical protein M422DRAFT_41042 [Sphaerobolus stellatus SS14]|nr:hypothetical protein M422DRAFT_41042 [Sphaerobolus stellatus SS14]